MTYKHYTTYYPNGRLYMDETRVDGVRVNYIVYDSREYNVIGGTRQDVIGGTRQKIKYPYEMNIIRHPNDNLYIIHAVINKTPISIYWHANGKLYKFQTNGALYQYPSLSNIGLEFHPNGNLKELIHFNREPQLHYDGLNMCSGPDGQAYLIQYYRNDQCEIVYDRRGCGEA